MTDGAVSLRVLVVDDEPLSRWSIAETLRDHGEMVVVAADAAGAARALRAASAPFDVVVLDYWLPDSRDLSFLKTLRTLDPGCPVILISARATREITEEALAFGAYSVLAKPVDMSEVSALVRRAHHDRPRS